MEVDWWTDEFPDFKLDDFEVNQLNLQGCFWENLPRYISRTQRWIHELLQETMLGNQRMEMHRLIHGYHDTAMRQGFLGGSILEGSNKQGLIPPMPWNRRPSERRDYSPQMIPKALIRPYLLGGGIAGLDSTWIYGNSDGISPFHTGALIQWFLVYLSRFTGENLPGRSLGVCFWGRGRWWVCLPEQMVMR